MTMAVKETPETNAARPFERLALESFVGVAFVLAGIWVVFHGIYGLWWDVLRLPMTAVTVSLQIVAMIAVAGGWVVLGARLAGASPRPGLRAGVFFAMVGLLAAAGFTSFLGGLLERQLANQVAGQGVTLGVGLLLSFLLVRQFNKSNFVKGLVRVEEQGWFSAGSYKKSQGLLVRRCTMLGLLVLAGCGVFTLWSHGSLVTGPRDWELSIPYTGRVIVERVGDVAAVQPLSVKQVLDAGEVAKANALLGQEYVKVTNAGDSQLRTGLVIKKEEFDKIVTQVQEQKKLPPTQTAPIPADFKSYPRITLLPDVVYTLPILLALASLWLSYRVINYPTFADFLIATEAELNKVSWTTRRRLIQDTVVVLVTVLLLTGFLFVVDQVWAQVLTRVGVLQLPTTQQSSTDQEVPW